jgi:hypothetical protein
MKVEQIIDEMQASLTKLRRHFRKTGTAGECTWSSDVNIPHIPCPVHGLLKPTPDPLHARVAKTNGKETLKVGGVWYTLKTPGDGFEVVRIFCRKEYVPILDYPNDLVAAMGALREYCKQKKYERYGRMVYRPDSEDYAVEILDNSHPYTEWGNLWVTADTLPQAICEAIVKHAEGK